MDRRDFLKASAAAALLPLVDLPVTPAQPKLKMFTNELDYVIAETVDEAKEIAFQLNFGTWPTPKSKHDPLWKNAVDAKRLEEFEEWGEWSEVPDHLDFTFRHGDGSDEIKTIREFIEGHGPGYFANSEY